MGRLTDETKDPISFSNLTKKEAQSVVTEYDNWADTRTNKKLAALGKDDLEGQLKVQQEADVLKGTYLNETGLKDATWEAEFRQVENTFDPETMDGKTLPPAVASALVSMDNLKDKPFALKRHASEEAMAISNLYQSNMKKGYNEVQALSMAQKAILAPKRLQGAEDKKTFNGDVRSAVSSELDSSWWQFSDKDIKVSQGNAIYAEVSKNAEMKYNLTGDMPTAIADAMAEYKDSHWQLDDGRMMPGSREEVARSMGIPLNRIDEVDDKILAFPATIMATLEEKGEVPETPYPSDEWIPVINGNRIRYEDRYGGVIGTYNLNELNNISNAELAKKLSDRSANLREERKKALVEESRSNALRAKFAESMLNQ